MADPRTKPMSHPSTAAIEQMLEVEKLFFERELELLPKKRQQTLRVAEEKILSQVGRKRSSEHIQKSTAAIRALRQLITEERLKLQIYRPILGGLQLPTNSNAFIDKRIAIELLQRFTNEFDEMLRLVRNVPIKSIRIEKERFIRRQMYQFDINLSALDGQSALKRLIYMVDNFGNAQYARVKMVSENTHDFDNIFLKIK